MRDFVLAGNWKMFKNPKQTKRFVEDLFPLITRDLQKRIILFPPTIDLHAMREGLAGTYIHFGGQDCHFKSEGAFTGETSPQTLKDVGAEYVLVGHSERRAYNNETDDTASLKVQAAQEFGLMPILCVGESLKEREAGQTFDVVGRQLRQGLSKAALNLPFLVAYEPVWAIGTGKVATPQQADEAHGFLRSQLTELGGDTLGSKTNILYGGSVKPENARDLAAQPNIDGFLIGGASLNPEDFARIIKISLS